MFRATAIAGKQPWAGVTLTRKVFVFRFAKRVVLPAVVHLSDGSVIDIAKFVLRIDIMIAVIHIAVHFHSKSTAACRGKHANLRRQSTPRRKSLIKELHRNVADILPDPHIKNRRKKFTKRQRAH